jgi:hypothetical protein
MRIFRVECKTEGATYSLVTKGELSDVMEQIRVEWLEPRGWHNIINQLIITELAKDEGATK